MAPASIVYVIALIAATKAGAEIGIWTASAWSQCSSPCSTGTAYRHVQCRSTIDNQILPPGQCPGPRPPTTKFCSSLECQWGCSANSAKPVCLSAFLKQVPDEFCNIQKHPGNFTDDFVCPYGSPELWQPLDPCTADDCQPGPSSYTWMVQSSWSSCTPRCGSNRFSWRQVACVNSTGRVVDDIRCKGAPPSDRRPCPGAVECSLQQGRCRSLDGNDVADYWCLNKTDLSSWRIESDWTPCSIPTWSISTRRVSCPDPPCSPSDRPSSVKSCALSPPLTYHPASASQAPICTDACGSSLVSNPFQCRFQDLELDDIYCQAAGVPDPVPTPCRTQICMSSKPCDLHARLNISIPPGAFASDEQIRTQLQLDLQASLPNASSIAVSSIRSVDVDEIEAEFSVSCNGSVSAADSIEMQISDPTSAFRRGVVTRGSEQHLEIFAFQQPVPIPVPDSSPVASSGGTDLGFSMATVYTALGVFVAVFVVIRCFVRKAAAKTQIQAPIGTMFAVNGLDAYTDKAIANFKTQTLSSAPETRRNSATRAEEAISDSPQPELFKLET